MAKRLVTVYLHTAAPIGSMTTDSQSVCLFLMVSFLWSHSSPFSLVESGSVRELTGRRTLPKTAPRPHSNTIDLRGTVVPVQDQCGFHTRHRNPLSPSWEYGRSSRRQRAMNGHSSRRQRAMSMYPHDHCQKRTPRTPRCAWGRVRAPTGRCSAPRLSSQVL